MLEFYKSKLRQVIAMELQYRGQLLIWTFSGILEPLVFLVVWTNVARNTGGSVGGYGAGDFAAYFIGAMLVHQITFSWHMWEYAYRIQQGQVSQAMLRPVHPIHGDVAENVGYKLLSVLVQIPAVVVLALLFHPTWHPHLWALLLTIPALLLAAGIRFLLDWTLALVAFWLTKTDAINNVYYVGVLFLSGRVAPLQLFPAWVQTVASLTPFRWVVAFPVELALGRLTPREVLIGFGAQAIWLPVALLLMRTVWKGAVRQYSGVGI